jgi:hypothetical protein
MAFESLVFDEVLVLDDRDDLGDADRVLYVFTAPGAAESPGPPALRGRIVRDAAALAAAAGGVGAPQCVSADYQSADGAWRDVRFAVLHVPVAVVALVGVLWGARGGGGGASAVAPPPAALHAALVEVLLWLVTALGPPGVRLRSWGESTADLAAALAPVMAAAAATRVPYALLRAAAGARGSERSAVAPPLRWAVDDALARAEAGGDVGVDGGPTALPVGGALLLRGAVVASHLCAADTADAIRGLALEGMAAPGRGAASRRIARVLHVAVDAGGRRADPAGALRLLGAVSGGAGGGGAVSFERRVVVAASTEDVTLCVLYAPRGGVVSGPDVDELGVDAIAGALHELRASGALEALRLQAAELDIRTTRIAGPPLRPGGTWCAQVSCLCVCVCCVCVNVCCVCRVCVSCVCVCVVCCVCVCVVCVCVCCVCCVCVSCVCVCVCVCLSLSFHARATCAVSRRAA